MLSLSVWKPMGCQAYIIWFIHAFRGSTDWKEMSITFLHSFSSLKHRLMWISAEIRWVDGTPTTEVTPSLSGRSIHLTLVSKWSWSWSWMTYCHPLCAMSIGPPILRYSYFKIWPCKSMVKVICVVKGQGHVWPWKFKGQGYGQGQTHWSYLRPGVQSKCLLFVSWQSDHSWLRYSKFHIWHLTQTRYFFFSTNISFLFSFLDAVRVGRVQQTVREMWRMTGKRIDMSPIFLVILKWQ